MESVLDAAIVILSALSSVVRVTLFPATNVNVSVVESAATVVCPDTAILEKAFWLTSPPDHAAVHSSPVPVLLFDLSM